MEIRIGCGARARRNDNDFIATVADSHDPTGIDNPNQFFVFAFDPALLPGFERQRIR